MDIAPDPKPDTVTDSDDGFDADFAEFAAGKTPAPQSEDEPEAAAPDGNGPGEAAAAPAKEDNPPEAAATDQSPDDATSGEADADGGPAPPSDDNQAPDPWANLPPELKAEVDKLQKERDEAVHRASSDASRVSALTRKLREVGQSGAPQQAAPEQPTEAQKALDAKITQLREDYGDIADPLIELIEAQRKELNNVRTVLTGMSEAQQSQVIAHETKALEARHSDWRQIAQSQDFAGWLELQPSNIQRLATSWDARETSVVLTLFKAERAEATTTRQTPLDTQQPKPDAATDAKRSQQLDGGRDVRSRPAPAASGPPEDFDTAFKYFTDKRQLAAQRR